MRIILTSIFFSLYNFNAYAYFDPGTGLFIIQGIIAIFGVIIFYLGYPIRLFRKMINKFKTKSEDRKVNTNTEK